MAENKIWEMDPMLLSLRMLADGMDEKLWSFHASLKDDTSSLRGCLIYCGQKDLQPDLVYLIPQGMGQDFPTDVCVYIAQEPLEGKAPHLDSLSLPVYEILNQVLSTFQKYRDFEQKLTNIVTEGGSLEDLCSLGGEFFDNPVYIHDELFSIVAMSGCTSGTSRFEYNERTGRGHISMELIEDFKFSPAYRETLTKHHADIWGPDHYPQPFRTLYVNLWDGSRYRGRLLINEMNSALLPGQFRMAEYLADYCVKILRRNDQQQNPQCRNFEQLFVELLTTGATDQQDLASMLDILGWLPGDSYLCMVLQRQNTASFVNSDSVFNSRLTMMLRDYTSFYYKGKLCVVIDLSRYGDTAASVRTLLAPHIRDSYMYGGLSNPLSGFSSIQYGFQQAEIALRYIRQENSSQWLVPFSHCALSYIRARAVELLPPELLAEPGLLELRELDRRKGTQYYETLEAYLGQDRNITKTSEALMIHRTTLTYRLEKIQEMLRMDLENRELRLYLQFSFYLLKEHPNGT